MVLVLCPNLVTLSLSCLKVKVRFSNLVTSCTHITFNGFCYRNYGGG